MMNYGFILTALVLNAVANILLKIAAIDKKGTSLVALLTNPLAILGVIIFAGNIYFYIQALRLFPISLVYPILAAAGFLIINTYGIWYLKEPFSLTIFLGYVAIILGIILITGVIR